MYILKMNNEKVAEALVPFFPGKYGWQSDGFLFQDLKPTQEYEQDNPEVLIEPVVFVSKHPDIKEPIAKVLTVIEFKMCFTIAERMALYALRDAGDAILTDWFSILDDPRCMSVDLGLKSTKDAMGYLTTVLDGFTAERAASVLAGEIF